MSFKKNIIVTGSSGQIGQSFVKHLSNNKRDYIIYALDKKKFDHQQSNVLQINIDITKEDEVLDFFSNMFVFRGLA